MIMTEAHSSPEVKNTVPLAFILDVDGVVTDPTEKKVTEPEIFTQLENHLNKGNIIALNTGRSNEWMIERVINPLASKLSDKKALKNFFAVGEKGLTWASFNLQGELIQGVFNKEGQPVEGFDLGEFLDIETVEHFKTLGNEARELIRRKYSHSTFFDNSKKAMVSTEMKDGYNQPDFAREQKEFTSELHNILSDLNLVGKFNVDPTTIATDIQVPFAGKHLGAKRILSWLKSQNSAPAHYIAVGDSSSDLEMADELHSQGKSVDFYYVNPKKPLSVEKPYSIHVTNKEFGNGTLEVFKKLTTSSHLTFELKKV